MQRKAKKGINYVPAVGMPLHKGSEKNIFALLKENQCKARWFERNNGNLIWALKI